MIHLYGTKRIVALLRDDPDEEIQRILNSDPSLVAIAKATTEEKANETQS